MGFDPITAPALVLAAQTAAANAAAATTAAIAPAAIAAPAAAGAAGAAGGLGVAGGLGAGAAAGGARAALEAQRAANQEVASSGAAPEVKQSAAARLAGAGRQAAKSVLSNPLESAAAGAGIAGGAQALRQSGGSPEPPLTTLSPQSGAAERAAEAERLRRRKSGRAATILTSPLGVSGTSAGARPRNVGVKTLLGQ